MDIVTAWRTHTEWRDHFLASAVREVSRHGSLDSHAPDYRGLAAGLTKGEVLGLYENLRRSLRPEWEWRGEFLALFPQVDSDDLPPPLVPEAEVRRQTALAREEALRVFGRTGPCVDDEDIPF